MQTETLKVTGMTSEASIATVIDTLTRIAGVKHVKVAYANGNAVVEFDERLTAPQEMLSALAKAGFSRDVQQEMEVTQGSCCGGCCS